MCRIFGVSYANQREELDTAEIAAILYPALVHQGPHAWGWMSYDEGENVVLSNKFPGRCDTPESYEIQMDEIDPEAKWFVGHVRYATHGSPLDNRNNHPVIHGKIMGVHNGVLRNHETILFQTGREDPKTEVDSEAIFAAVNRWGPSSGLRRLRGDVVTVYTDLGRPHVLHIGRTHGRQLTIGWTERGNLIFASEQQALEKLEPEIKFRKFSVISENRLLIVRNGKIIQRHTFAAPTPPYKGPQGTVVLPRGTVLADTFGGQQAANRASKRGEMMFPKVPQGTEERRRAATLKKIEADKKRRERELRGQFDMVPSEIVTGDGQPPRPMANQNRKLYYWNGQLLTHDEYVEAIEYDEWIGR